MSDRENLEAPEPEPSCLNCHHWWGLYSNTEVRDGVEIQRNICGICELQMWRDLVGEYPADEVIAWVLENRFVAGSACDDWCCGIKF